MFVQCINNACGEQHNRQKCQGRSKLVEGGMAKMHIDIQHVVSKGGWGYALQRKILEARRAFLHEAIFRPQFPYVLQNEFELEFATRLSVRQIAHNLVHVGLVATNS